MDILKELNYLRAENERLRKSNVFLYGVLHSIHGLISSMPPQAAQEEADLQMETPKNSTEDITEPQSEEKRKGFFRWKRSAVERRKKAETMESKCNHTVEEKNAMVEFIQTNGFDADKNNFLIACFKNGITFGYIQQIAAMDLNVEQMDELLNILVM